MTLIVPFLAGGGTDIAARMLAMGLGRMWNVPVRVDNLTGVAGTVGANAVAHAPPDGHTLLIGTLGTQAINPLLYKSMPYQPELAFAPVSLIARWPMVLVVRPDERARTIQGLIAWAHNSPAELKYGSSGTGGSPQMAAALFESRMGIQLVHVPDRGSALALDHLLRGFIDMAFVSVLEVSTRVRKGQFLGLATTGLKRSDVLPSVPTLSETVAPGFDFVPWVGVLAPYGTPNDVVTKISSDVRAVLESGSVHDSIAARGGMPGGNTPLQFKRLIDSERKKYSAAIRERKVKVQ